MSQNNNQDGLNKKSKSEADTLSDLLVPDEQANRATGGGVQNQGKLIVGVDKVQLMER